MLFSAVSCQHKITADLISYASNTEPDITNIDISDDKYSSAFLDFSAELISQINEDKNILLSPLSIYLALSMLANGAEGDTLSQIENALGLTLQELNSYCYYIINSMKDREKSTLNSSNSLWINKDYNVEVNDDYLEANALYYIIWMFIKINFQVITL